MATRRGKKNDDFHIVVDERTDAMTDEALQCRGDNHVWARLPTPRERVIELWTQGMVEKIRVCTNGCGGRWTQIRDRITFQPVLNRRTYDDPTYLVRRGSGRLTKSEAARAQFAREHPELV